MHILFCCKNEKNMLQKEIKDWTFGAYSLTKEISSWFVLIASLKMTCVRSCVWFWNFIREGLFFVACIAQTGEITDLSKVSKREQIGSILTCPKLAKWILTLNWSKSANDQFENLYISSHGEGRNISHG